MARLFDLIENPETGWTTRKIKRCVHIGAPEEWLVELMKVGTGLTIEKRHESLHVAWLRACEAANMSNQGIDRDLKDLPAFVLDAEHQALVDEVVDTTAANEARSVAKINGEL